MIAIFPVNADNHACTNAHLVDCRSKRCAQEGHTTLARRNLPCSEFGISRAPPKPATGSVLWWTLAPCFFRLLKNLVGAAKVYHAAATNSIAAYSSGRFPIEAPQTESWRGGYDHWTVVGQEKAMLNQTKTCWLLYGHTERCPKTLKHVHPWGKNPSSFPVSRVS